MLAHMVPRDARPFGAALLTVRLILSGTPRTPARSAFSFSPTRKFNFSQANKQQQTHPARRPRFSRKRKHTRPRHPARRGLKNMVFQTQGIEPLDAVINVRLTSAEKATLKEDADLAGLSMSELVRRRYFGRPIIANADAVMLKELRRLGGLLKHIHNQSAGAYSQATASAIAELRVYIQKLSSKP